MISYRLDVEDVDDLVPELAKAMDTTFANNYGEFITKIPAHLGFGYISGINFPNGVGLHIMDCTFNDKTELLFKNNGMNSLRFNYCLHGSLEHTFSSSDEHILIERAQHLISAPKYNENQSFIFKAKEETLICYLEIDKAKFQEQLSFPITTIEAVFYDLFADVNALNRLSYKGFYSLQISDIISDILNFDDDGLVRINFLGAKALEAVSLMLKLYREDVQQQVDKPTLRLQDMDSVTAAVNYIENNITDLKTIPEIAKAVGIESYRLQEGFKKVYGLTVNDFIRDYRLKRSLILLTSKNKNVSEVVYELGLTSRSYFSKIFKEKYGVSPSELLKNEASNEEKEES